MLVAQAPDRFGFLHLTFQGFYAAGAVAKKGEQERTRLIARFWDHPDWREVWPLYALAVQNDPTKHEHLFATILDSGHELDAHLYRPQLACLRLAGLGGATLPPTAKRVVDWACNVLKGTAGSAKQLMTALSSWERQLTHDLRATLVAGWSGYNGLVSWAAGQALATSVGEADVRVALLAGLDDEYSLRRWAAAKALAAVAGEEEVRRVLLVRLGDDDLFMREGVARALAAVAGDAEVRMALLAQLGDEEEFVRRAAADALAAVAGEAEVRAALLARLRDNEAHVRWAAAEALAAAVDDAEVQAALLARLGDDEAYVR